MFITKELVRKLNDENITKREYDAIVDEIGKRVDHIWKTLLKISNRKYSWYAFQNDVLLKISNRKYSWYAFQNDVYADDGNGSDGGCFDPENDGDFIKLDGDFTRHSFDGDFIDGFPTRFLWTDDDIWKSEVLNHIKQNKIKLDQEDRDKKKKAEAKKIERNKIIESIKSKLSKEELKYVSFK